MQFSTLISFRVEQQTFIELLLFAKLCSQLCEALKIMRCSSHLGEVFRKVTNVHIPAAQPQTSLFSAALVVGLTFPLCTWRLRCDLCRPPQWNQPGLKSLLLCVLACDFQPDFEEASVSTSARRGWEFHAVMRVKRSAESLARGEASVTSSW